MKNVSQVTLKSLVILMIFAFILSCSKTDPINLKATLLYDADSEIAAENGEMIVNLALSEPIGKDLLINATFKSNPEYYNADEDDYSKKLEYSTDFGQTWIKETQDEIVHFPKNIRSIKIKVPLKEDQEIEPFYEEIDLVISKAPGQNDLKVLEQPIKFHLTIKDIEDVNREGDGFSMMVFQKPPYPAGVKDFEIMFAENFPAKDLAFFYKKQHHEQYFKTYLEYAEEFFKTINAKVGISVHEVIDSRNVGGYVQNPNWYNPSELSEDEANASWTFGLNIRPVYSSIFSGGINPVANQSAFNADGVSAFILTHEMGHILSLHIGKQTDNTKNSETCEGYFDTYGTCFKKEGWSQKFYDKFYNPKTRDSIQGKEFVTNYASISLGEDLAETLAYYTLQLNDLPELNENSSTALQKMHFISQFEEVQLFAKHFNKLQLGNTATDEKVTERPSSSSSSNHLPKSPLMMNSVEGKVVSCLDAWKGHKKNTKRVH